MVCGEGRLGALRLENKKAGSIWGWVYGIGDRRELQRGRSKASPFESVIDAGYNLAETRNRDLTGTVV